MVIASQQPHIARTTDRKISFLSEVLVQIGKAKLALDIIPDDAQEHKYYAFTTRFLSWIAQTTTGLPRPRVTSHVGQSTVSTPATATVEPPWLDVNPQGKLTRGDYRWAVHRGIAEQDSIINYPGERGEQSLSTPDVSAVFSDCPEPDAEPEPEQQPTISNVRRARLPLPPSFRDQEPFVPLQQKPVMKRDPSTAPDKPREMETTSQSPDFIIFLYTMDPVLGIWNTQPIFAVENKRKITTEGEYELLAGQVRKQAKFMFAEYPALQGTTLSTLSLVGGEYRWCDWRWNSGSKEPVLQNPQVEPFRPLFVQEKVDGPDGIVITYDDVAEDFKRRWKKLACRHYLQCNSFYHA